MASRRAGVTFARDWSAMAAACADARSPERPARMSSIWRSRARRSAMRPPVGWTAAEAAERVGSERPAIRGMAVPALIVGLPDLEHRIGHDIALAIPNAALDADVGTGKAGVGHHGAEDLAGPVPALREADVEVGAHGLGGCALRHGRDPAALPCCPAARCRNCRPAPTPAA